MNASAAVVDRDVAAPISPGVPGIGIKRLAIYCAIGLSAAAVVTYGYHWVTVGRFLESTDDAYVGGDVTIIAPKVAGFIEQVAVTDNQRVEAGELLVKLDDRDYRAALGEFPAAMLPIVELHARGEGPFKADAGRIKQRRIAQRPAGPR